MLESQQIFRANNDPLSLESQQTRSFILTFVVNKLLLFTCVAIRNA